MIINSFSKYFCMTGWRIGWMVVPEPLVRAIDRLQGNLAISVPTLSQIAAEAAFEGRDEMDAVKHGYQENRRILLDGLPKAGFEKFLPVDGAFYLYADVSRFCDDSFEFAQRMLSETHVAVTPGVDFDPRRPNVHPLLLCGIGAGDGRGGGAYRSLAQPMMVGVHALWGEWPSGLDDRYRNAAAILPPSTVVTSPVVFNSIAWCKKAWATSSAVTSRPSKFPRI